MKKHISLILVIFFTVTGNYLLYAAPRAGNRLGRDYLVNIEDISKWNAGLYSNLRKHKTTLNGLSLNLESGKMMGYVGYDFKPWFTTYIAAGSTETKIGSMPSDTNPEYGIGASFSLLSYSIPDPTILENRIEINGGLQYNTTKATWSGKKYNLRELYASLTISLINDIMGSKYYQPDSIAVFAGPIYSDIQSSSFNESDTFGFTIGLEIFYTKRVSMYAGIESFDSPAFMAGIDLQF